MAESRAVFRAVFLVELLAAFRKVIWAVLLLVSAVAFPVASQAELVMAPEPVSAAVSPVGFEQTTAARSSTRIYVVRQRASLNKNSSQGVLKIKRQILNIT